MITKTVIKCAATLIGLILIIFCTPLRYFNPAREGSGNGSKDINDSRERGVYLLSYKVKSNPVVLKNGLTLYVKEAWAERVWTHGVFSNETRVQYNPAMFHLCILFSNEETFFNSEFTAPGRLQLGTYPNIMRGNGSSRFTPDFALKLPPESHYSLPIVRLASGDQPLIVLDTLGSVELYADDW
ncbi:MAG TPA: hypothetical protein PLW14_13520 [Chlorobiota bacterium]|nr:hypothetical protein [Chlorobiota bacterium]